MNKNIEYKIIELRKQNKGYKTIANELNINRDKVRYVCQKNNLDGCRDKTKNTYGTIEEREEIFKYEFEQKFPNFKYHSDFKNVDSMFKSECGICGHIQERNAQCTRRDKEIQCDRCNQLKKLSSVLKRQATGLINIINNIVVKDCKEEERKQEKEKQDKINKEVYRIRRISVCQECGKVFTGERIGLKYCSTKCKNKRNNRFKEIRKGERYKRMKENGKIDWSISLDKLIKRDKNICHICGSECDKEDYTIVDGNFIVGSNYPSIDHVIPITKGGTHTWENIKLSHHYCNTIKSNNEVYEEGTGQLKMII